MQNNALHSLCVDWTQTEYILLISVVFSKSSLTDEEN